jgi:hypothetical protein
MTSIFIKKTGGGASEVKCLRTNQLNGSRYIQTDRHIFATWLRARQKSHNVWC